MRRRLCRSVYPCRYWLSLQTLLGAIAFRARCRTMADTVAHTRKAARRAHMRTLTQTRTCLPDLMTACLCRQDHQPVLAARRLMLNSTIRTKHWIRPPPDEHALASSLGGNTLTRQIASHSVAFDRTTARRNHLALACQSVSESTANYSNRLHE